ncbi:hypothetical protein N8I77_004942 [Diaporthe amygdali]|uniref:Uncharacterized protein n=1 Tax=Phomopsis amygdali TaxID=1214568 RepID=A0AAD9SNJ9_PHOAM|nr:hypothetical protein N8I77_004942 [Diaporthe amygdali]
MGHKYKKPLHPSIANGGKHHCPECRKAPMASCFGHHLFICKKHRTHCYTKVNPCQLCEADQRRQVKAEQKEANQDRLRKELLKEQQKEEARRKMDRKMRWTETRKASRLAVMRGNTG